MAVKAATIIGGGTDWIPKVQGTPGDPFPLASLIHVPKGCIKIVWAPGDTGDTGEWVQIPQFGDKHVVMYGTAVTSVSIEGSDSVDVNGLPNNPFILHDPTVTGLVTLIAAGIKQLLESPQFIRPLYTTATACVVTLFGRNPIVSQGA